MTASLVFDGAIRAAMEVLDKGKIQVHCGQAMDDSDVWTRDESDEEFAARQDRAILDFFASHPVPLDEYYTAPKALEVMRNYRKK